MGKASKKESKKHEAFAKVLEKALKQFDDPGWLGENSPLAAPYFLGEYLREGGIDVTRADERGRGLRKLLRETINRLGEQGEVATDHSRLLYFSFLDPDTKEWPAKKIADEKLNVSRAQYFRTKPEAIRQLSDSLLHRLRPSLRVEEVRPQPHLVGRNKLIESGLAGLKEGKSVGLTGLGGIGKTTLGQDMAAKMAAQKTPAFWFTFRLGLNDNFNSLIFALASFLARQGASTLWSQLIADKAHLDMDKALGLLRYDLSHPTLKRPVLCFDKVDLLRPAELEDHATLLTFLESLKGLAPLLFIGQQLPLEVQAHHRLKNLSVDSIQMLLNRAEITLSTADLERVQTYTQGNPRLLELFIGLHRAGEPIDKLLAQLSSVPSLEFLLRRMWQRLDQDQQMMLFSLAPFRRAAPRDAWNQTGEQDALEELIRRRLVQEPDLGQITLLPAFKGVVRKWLSADHHKTVHLRAGMIRTERAEYTLATDHYLQADEDEIAFRLWHDHQEQEINQGQAGTALTVLEKISIKQLKEQDQERLILLRAKLLKITGEYERSGQSLASITWQNPILEAQAKRLKADIAELTGKLQEATNAYLAGLDTIEKLLSEKAQFHKNLGWVAMHQHKLDDAWRQAMLADYEAENLKGYIQERRGQINEAKPYYIRALTLAQQAHYHYGWAKTCNNLGRLMALQGEFDAAEEFWQKANKVLKKRGQVNGRASIRVNQAMSLNLARRHQAAIAPAKEALEIFERLGEPWGRRSARVQLAEAYFGISDLDKAQIAAQEVIQHEEGREVYDAWWVLGEVQLAQGQHKEAVDSFERVTNYAEQHNLPILKGYGLRSLGKTYRAIGDDEAAQTTFDRAIERFEALGMQNEVEETRKVRGW